MEYQWLVTVSQTAGLLLFVGLFLAVLIYALWPGNKRRFERAARVPLEDGDRPDNETERGGDGRQT